MIKKLLIVGLLMLSTISISNAAVTEIRSGEPANYTCLSTDEKPTPKQIGQTLLETDTFLFYNYYDGTWNIHSKVVVYTDTLTTSDSEIILSTNGYDEFSVSIDGGGTSLDCGVKLQGKIGTSGYGILDSSADSLLISDTTTTTIRCYKDAGSMSSLKVLASSVSAGDSLFINVGRKTLY